MRFQIGGHRYIILFLALLLLGIMVSCENNAGRNTQTTAAKSVVSSIKSKEHFKQVVETSKDRLLLFEFYADWCPPCKGLAPVMEEIARESRDVLDVYKINTDKNGELARDFRITGIPHVSFFKNKEIVLSLSGAYPKKMYLKAIERLSSATSGAQAGQQGGT